MSRIITIQLNGIYIIENPYWKMRLSKFSKTDYLISVRKLVEVIINETIKKKRRTYLTTK